MTRHRLVHVALVVRDYDEAIAFYTGKLGFTLVDDTYQPEQERFVGDQTGGRVFLFLETDDFWRDYETMSAAGITFVRPPSEQSYGMVAVFEDLYGNRWDLLEYHDTTAPPNG